MTSATQTPQWSRVGRTHTDKQDRPRRCGRHVLRAEPAQPPAPGGGVKWGLRSETTQNANGAGDWGPGGGLTQKTRAAQPPRGRRTKRARGREGDKRRKTWTRTYEEARTNKTHLPVWP